MADKRPVLVPTPVFRYAPPQGAGLANPRRPLAQARAAPLLSPLDMTDFSDLGLSPTTLKAVADTGYTTATPIQAQAIPVALAGRDEVDREDYEDWRATVDLRSRASACGDTRALWPRAQTP